MTRYSITRRRHIKKYKKSRKGCGGRGRRSVRSGKTRKPKGFRKAKRHTLGNRRRTGGDVVCEGYKFTILSDQVASYMFNNGITTSLYSSQELRLIGFGIAFVTNADKSASFKKYNRPECLAIFIFGHNLYIVRGKYPHDDNTDIYGVLVLDYNTTCITRLSGELPKADEIAAKITGLGCAPSKLTPYMVTTTSGVNYRIAICSDVNHPFTPTFGPSVNISRAPTDQRDRPDNINKLFSSLVDTSTHSRNIPEFLTGLVTVDYPI